MRGIGVIGGRVLLFLGVLTGFCLISPLSGFCQPVKSVPVQPAQKLDPKLVTKPEPGTPLSPEQKLARVKVETLETPSPQADCTTPWRAQVHNANSEVVGPVWIEILQYDPPQQKWLQASNSGALSLQSNERKTLQGTWKRLQHATQTKAVVRVSGSQATYNERVVTLGAYPAPTLEVVSVEFPGIRWKAGVKNNNPSAECYLSAQAYALRAGENSGGAPAGGRSFQIQGNATVDVGVDRREDWRKGFDRLRVAIYRNNQVVAERIFPMP